MYNRATPENYLIYKQALTLYKLFWSTDYSLEFASLNINTVLTSRQLDFKVNKSNNLKVGTNAFANRLYILNDKIPLTELNKSFTSFKFFCKNKFLIN